MRAVNAGDGVWRMDEKSFVSRKEVRSGYEKLNGGGATAVAQPAISCNGIESSEKKCKLFDKAAITSSSV